MEINEESKKETSNICKLENLSQPISEPHSLYIENLREKLCRCAKCLVSLICNKKFNILSFIEQPFLKLTKFFTILKFF